MRVLINSGAAPPLSVFMVLFLRLRGALFAFTVPIIFGNINLRPSLRQFDGALFYAPVIPAPFLGTCARLRVPYAPSWCPLHLATLEAIVALGRRLPFARYTCAFPAPFFRCLCAPSGATSQRLHGALPVPSWCPCTFMVPITFGNINLRPSLCQVDGSAASVIPAPFLRFF